MSVSESLKTNSNSLWQKLHKANLSPEERRQILERREKYAQTDMIRQIGAASFSAKLSDPVLFDIHDSMKTLVATTFMIKTRQLPGSQCV